MLQQGAEFRSLDGLGDYRLFRAQAGLHGARSVGVVRVERRAELRLGACRLSGVEPPHFSARLQPVELLDHWLEGLQEPAKVAVGDRFRAGHLAHLERRVDVGDVGLRRGADSFRVEIALRRHVGAYEAQHLRRLSPVRLHLGHMAGNRVAGAVGRAVTPRGSGVDGRVQVEKAHAGRHAAVGEIADDRAHLFGRALAGVGAVHLAFRSAELDQPDVGVVLAADDRRRERPAGLVGDHRGEVERVDPELFGGGVNGLAEFHDLHDTAERLERQHQTVLGCAARQGRCSRFARGHDRHENPMTQKVAMIERISERATDYAAGAAVVSPLWLPSLQTVSETAHLLLPILGCLWFIYQMWHKWRHPKP